MLPVSMLAGFALMSPGWQLPPIHVETRSEALANIQELVKQRDAQGLDELLAYAANRRDVAEPAESGYLRLANKLQAKPNSFTINALTKHAPFIEMGAWLAEGLQSPHLIPMPARLSLLRGALARSYADYDAGPREYSFVCGSCFDMPRGFVLPDPVKRLLAGAPHLAIELLSESSYRHKTKLLSVLSDTRPPALSGLLLKLITDRYSSVRTAAVGLSGMLSREDALSLLETAAADTAWDVREAALQPARAMANRELSQRLNDVGSIDISVTRSTGNGVRDR